MTLKQWLCGKLCGHDWINGRYPALIYERGEGRHATIEFDVCAKCGLESEEFKEVTHADD